MLNILAVQNLVLIHDVRVGTLHGTPDLLPCISLIPIEFKPSLEYRNLLLWVEYQNSVK